MNTIYETNRLLLEVVSPHKAGLVADFYNRNFEDFSRFEPLDDGARTSFLHKRILAYEIEQFKKGLYFRTYIFEKKNPLYIIGTISYRDISYGYSRKTVVGYKIDKDFRRKGYSFEALMFLNGIIFNELKLNRIEATVLPDNEASIALLSKLGFVNEGMLRQSAFIQGAFRDHYLFSLLSRDYYSLYSKLYD